MYVLYVEDNPYDVNLTRYELSRFAPDIKLDVVEGQSEAIARLEQMAPGEYDVVLTDMNLKDGDGLALLTRIRAAGWPVAVVVVTGSGNEQTAVTVLKSGGDDYIAKSDDYLARLPTVLANALSSFRAAAARRKQPLRVLYAERNAADIELTCLHMAREAPHIHIDAVRSTREALEKLGTATYDLLLLDYRLPEMDGLEALKEVREVRRLDIPVVLTTGHGDEEVAVQALRLGAADYLVKNTGYMLKLPWVLETVAQRGQLARQHAQLLQSQKMEAVGRLTAGIAHDFNNLLTAINGFAEIALRDMRPNDPLRKSVDRILSAGQRAADLIRKLMLFSHEQAAEPRVLNLNATLHETESMLRRIITENIALTTSLAADLWPVRTDPTQIEQVIVNLAVNARDAMPTGGRLTVETANATLGQAEAAGCGATAGDYVRLTIRDTGIGMSDEVKAHLFEPFFTTKGAGGGTGLGLSTVYGIVTGSGGAIAVESQPGQGATFHIYLPRVREAAPLPARRETLAGAPTGHETILLVEDDDNVRDMLRLVLQTQGYTVLEARDAEEASQRFNQRQGAVHLLLTDAVMPGMSGPELAKWLRTLSPELKVVLMSGYSQHAVAAAGGDLGADAGFLQKPCDAADMLRTVRQVLDREQGVMTATSSSSVA